MRALVVTAFLLALPPGIANAQLPPPALLQIPPGTILPVRLNHALFLRNPPRLAKPSPAARIMEECSAPQS